MRTAPRRSRVLPTALALLVVTSSFAGATTAGAAPRDADAVGVRAELALTVEGVTTSGEGAIGLLSGPPSGTTHEADPQVELGDTTATVAARDVSSAVTSTELQARATSTVTGARVSVPAFDELLGGTLVDTGGASIRAEAVCRAGAAPIATVDGLTSVLIAGGVVPLKDDGSANTVRQVPGVGAVTVELQVGTTVATTATTAAAGLTLQYTVRLPDGGDSALGGDNVVGTVTIAEVSCQAPAEQAVSVVEPVQGPTSGGTLVRISGTGFVPGATTVAVDGEAVPASAVAVAPDGTSLTFRTPAHAAGDVRISATTTGTTSDLLGFRYVTPVDAPTATGISPAGGPVTGGTAITITGSGFEPGVTTVAIGSLAVASDDIVVALGGASLTFTSPAHVAGPVDVTVTTPRGSTPALRFSYAPVTGPAPTATAITPATGPATGGTVVQVSGTGFVAGATSVTVGGVAVPASEVVVALGGTTLTFATPPHPAGPVDVTVTTAGGTSESALGYTYAALTGPAPTTTAIAPAEGPTTGGTAVTVTGTGFIAGATVVQIGGAPVTPTVATGGTSLTFTTPPHEAGPVDVTVTTPGGTTPVLGFAYVAPTGPVPTVSAITPDAGPTSGGTSVVIAGTGFVPGATSVAIGGLTILAADVVVAPDGASLTFTTPPHAPGLVDVTVATPGGTGTLALGFTFAAVPTATELDIHQGPTAGGTKVTVTGSGFVPGETTVAFDGVTVILADGVEVAPDGRSLSFTTPARTAGDVAITVTTPGGTTTPPLTYTYAGPSPDGTGGPGTNGAGTGTGGGRLATTGSDVADLVLVALAAIGAGGALLWSRRRALRHTSAAA